MLKVRVDISIMSSRHCTFEGFVEKNHQDQFKIDNQTKSIRNKQIQATRAARSGVQARVKQLNKKRSRPKFKKIKKEVDKNKEPQQTKLLELLATKKQKLDPQEQPKNKNVTPPSQQHNKKLSSNERQFDSSSSPAISMEFEKGNVWLWSGSNGWALRSFFWKVEQTWKLPWWLVARLVELRTRFWFFNWRRSKTTVEFFTTYLVGNLYLSISLKKAPVLNFEIDCHLYLHVVSTESCGISKFIIRNRFLYNLNYLSAISLNKLASY